jgi:hypothetical protein
MKICAVNPYLGIGLGVAAAGILVASVRPRPPSVRLATSATPAAAAAVRDPGPALDLTESTILAQRKRIMGRQRSLEMVSRVANEIGPLVRRALELPDLQNDLRALAASAGMSEAEYRRYFQAKHEADLLLESGGDANARSVSNAIGVAQFLAGTGRRCGLKVDEVAARPISGQMAAIEAKIDWLSAQPPDWRKAAPGQPGKAPDIGAPVGLVYWKRDQWIEAHRAVWHGLESRRRRCDQRYDPARAIAAQTRYLLRLTRQYGTVAWALQAYHGGEGGVARTINLYRAASASANLAGGRLPSYEEVYQRSTPTGRSGAFYYLYGRSDDHRYYWWKVLMAERAIRLYRDDRESFMREREALRPGYRMEVAWYGDPAPRSFYDVASLRRGAADATLVPVPPDLERRRIKLAEIAPMDRERRAEYKRLRPEAMGALLQLAAVYRANGGHAPLVILSLVQTTEGARAWRRLHPLVRPKPAPGEIVVDDPDFHPTGLVFDLARPANEWDRRVLEYALGWLYDRLRISWQMEQDGQSRHYHVVPNPTCRDELGRAALPSHPASAKR